MAMAEKLEITNDWDKVFKLSEKVNHKKITFHNRFGITLVGDLYEPKEQTGKLPAIAVCDVVHSEQLKSKHQDYMQ